MIALEDIYLWLNKFDPSHILPSTDKMIDQVRKALDEGRKDEARGLLQQLKDLAYHLQDNEEVTEVLIECGNISFMLNDFVEAEHILVDGVSRAWSDLHRRAVIQWMLGCVQWQSLPTRHQAVISWRNSLSDIERLARQPGFPPGQHGWYQETGRRLELSLLESLEQVGRYVDIDDIPSSGTTDKGFPAQSGTVSANYAPPRPTSTQTTEKSSLYEFAPKFTSDILQLFTISEEIPAGDFGPSGTDPFPIGTVEIEHVNINGHPYGIHSTRGRKIINLPFDQKLTVVKVKGDSMDLENITAQDYVLLRRVDVPNNGDIVMAEVVGIDSHATLKLFFRETDAITLRPHSTNPEHMPFVFKKINEGFYIRGVVVAILKPL
jgi:hypothetical protein